MALVESDPLLHGVRKHVNAEGYKGLGFDGVLGGSAESLYSQVLLDPLEKGLDLPVYAAAHRSGVAFPGMDTRQLHGLRLS